MKRKVELVGGPLDGKIVTIISNKVQSYVVPKLTARGFERIIYIRSNTPNKFQYKPSPQKVP